MKRLLRVCARLVPGAVLTLALFCLGCGGTGVVSGKVTVNGVALPKELITFLSEVGNKDVYNAAIADGVYRTAEIPCGPAKVIIIPALGEGPPPEAKGIDLRPPVRPVRGKANVQVPAKYQSADTSGLQLTIKPGENP